MTPRVFLQQMWGAHRWPLMGLSLLIVANVILALSLQLHLVPSVNEREQLLSRRTLEHRSGIDTSPMQQFVEGEKNLAAFLERIPPHREFTGLIVELQQLANRASLELAQINYSNELDKTSNQLRYQLTFTVNGNYRAVKQFIHSLEQSPRLIIIKQIGLQGVGQAGGTDVRLQLNLETFFRSELS
jgi:Tfp pilus assembly protein PilO